MKAKHPSRTSIAGTLALALTATFLGMVVFPAAGPGATSSGLGQGVSPSDATGLLGGLERALVEKAGEIEYAVAHGLGHIERVCVGRCMPKLD